MNPSLQYIKDKFLNYYSNAELKYPERFTRREWGFMFLGESFMQRHLGFRKSAELVQFLKGGGRGKFTSTSQSVQKNVPAHVYYSSAYYNEPNLQPMQAKVEGWLGADLIFDLDDDHLRNVEGLSYAQRLDRVKDIVRHKLLDDFILGDFGFDPKNIKIAFSGSRGYHIHVNDPQVLPLGSPQRREIVDYLIGLGLNLDRVFPMEVFDSKEYGGRKYSKKPKVVTPKLDAAGWKGRMARGVFELIKKLSQLPDTQAREELLLLSNEIKHKGRKITKKDIDEIYFELFSRPGVKFDKDTFDQRNILEIFSKDLIRDRFLTIVKEYEKVEMAGETDEPVTTDVKRLIRMPTSLHGKTGFRVVPLTIDELAKFEPLNDAVVFGSEPKKVNITTNEPYNFKLNGEDFTVKPGMTELPEFAVVYLICQRKAEVA
jgi:DNA primase small subunit